MSSDPIRPSKAECQADVAEPHELVDKAVDRLSNATVVCPELLARLVDDLLDPEAPQGGAVVESEAASE